jgi:predicted PurR-regulated permease PerM
MVEEVFGFQRMSSDNSGIFNYIEQDKSGHRPSRVPRALAIAASTVIILAGIQAASGLLGPMLLALFLAIILLVPLRWLQNHGCPQFLAFLFVLVCTIVLFVLVTYFVGQSLNVFIRGIPEYKDKVVEKYEQLETHIERLGFMIGERILPVQEPPAPIEDETVTDEQAAPEPAGPPLAAIIPILEPNDEATEAGETEMPEVETEEATFPPEDVLKDPFKEVERLVQAWEQDPERPLIALDPQTLAYWLARVMLYLRSMLEGGFLVLIFTIFMLVEASYFPAKVRRAFSKDSPINIEHFHRIAEDVRRYLILKTIANLMSGGAAMFVYYMFGIETFFLWGVIAFVMYYIPNIGGTLAAIIPGILILINNDISMVVLYAFCLLTIECTIAYGIEPKILGHGLRLSTMVIILSLFFWGFLLGPIGLFLAAPLTVVIKIVLQAFPETRWLAIFLDAGRETKINSV